MRHRRGFTLIELLVVIAIIALLVSILMPSLQKAKELAKDVVCKANHKNVGYGIVLYAQEHEDQIPYNVRAPVIGGDAFQDLLSWAVRIGKCAEDQIPDAYDGSLWGGEGNDPGDAEYNICREGYVDLNYYKGEEGAFKCPAAVDQVPNKGPAAYDDGDKISWGVHFSMNSSMSPIYNYDSKPSDRSAVTTTDIRGGAVMIGDCTIRQAGWPIVPAPRYSIDMYGDLRKLPADEEEYPTFGPWMHQPRTWGGLSQDLNLYGHPGESFNIGLGDGSVQGRKVVNRSDWNIN